MPGTTILGSTVLPIVFAPEDRVRNAPVRVVQDLQYGFIVGASFRSNKSVISPRQTQRLPALAGGAMGAVSVTDRQR